MIDPRLPFPTPETQGLTTSLYDTFRELDAVLASMKRQSPQIAIVPMTAATGTAAALAWRNPYSNQRLIITRLILDIEIGATTATIEIGTSLTATSLSNNLIDTMSINSAGAFGNITNAGTNGADCRRLNAGEYITGTITGTVGSFKANCYIEFYFADPVT